MRVGCVMMLMAVLASCADPETQVVDAGPGDLVDAGVASRCAVPVVCTGEGLVGRWRLVEACETSNDPVEPCGFRATVVTSAFAGTWAFGVSELVADASYERSLLVDVPPACGLGSCRDLGAQQGLDCVERPPQQCACNSRDPEREVVGSSGSFVVTDRTLTVTASSSDRYTVCRSGDVLHVQRDLGGDVYVFVREER